MKQPAIKEMKITDLKAAEYNPRAISQKALTGLQESLKRFGLVQPIVWNKRTRRVVAGHQRLKALKEIGEKTALVLIVDWPETMEKEANISLNNRAIEGDFTTEVKAMLDEIEARDKDVFEKLLLDEIDFPEEDDANAKAADDPVSAGASKARATGEIWKLGRHKLMCGDATDPTTLIKLMAGQKAQLVFTDPPYGVSYNAKSGKFEQLKGDDKRGDDLITKLLLPAFKNAMDHTRKDAAFYIWHASSTREDFAYAMKHAGLEERHYLIWVKPQIVLGWGDYRWAHEPCFYASRAGTAPAFFGGRDQSTVWRVSVRSGAGPATNLGTGLIVRDGKGNTVTITPGEGTARRMRALRLEDGQHATIQGPTDSGDCWEVSRDHGAIHPTQKPVALGVRAMQNSTQEGDAVIDMFLGSGSTLMAAELTDRICYGIEYERGYCEAIIERWEKFTGKKAEKA